MRLSKIYMSILALIMAGMPVLRGEELKESSYKIFSEASYNWNPAGHMTYEPEGWEMVQPLFYRIAANGEEAIVSSPLTYGILRDEDDCRGGMYAGVMRVPAQVPDATGRPVPVTAIEGFQINGVTELYLPSTIRDLGNSISRCSMLELIEFDDSLEEIRGVSNCVWLETCRLPSGLKRVGDMSMFNLGLKEIEFPVGLEEVGEMSFCYNYVLERLDLGNLRRSGNNSFSHLQSLQKLTLPESLESLGDYSFAYCSALEELWLPSHSVSYGERCFRYATSLRRIICPSATPYAWPLEEVSPEDIVLYVPAGSEELYRNAPGWKDASAILPLTQLAK